MRFIVLILLLLGMSGLAACGGEDAPTVTPTPSPTDTPTETPTTAPTDIPTAAPTTAPTDLPTDALTATATDTPTEAPTTTPTFRPTEVLATPDELDREFGTSERLEAERERLVSGYIERNLSDERVLAAMRAVPRHSFIPTNLLGSAYEDHPLPIGYGQTISQPSLVAWMTELLELEEGDRVLEIGTGSGYQAAILAELTHAVYTVEIIPELAATARAVLDELGYDYVETDRRDGYFGWYQYAPFDAIIVTAAPDHLPQPLVAQLSPDGGRMVIPIGPVGDVQTLWLIVRNGAEIEMRRLIPVRFVPFTRGG